MTEKDKQMNEEVSMHQNKVEKESDRQSNSGSEDKKSTTAQHKSWFKQITRQTIISSIIFFVLGGAISAGVMALTHSGSDRVHSADNRGFPNAKEKQDQPRPGGPNKDSSQTEESEDKVTNNSTTSHNNA